MRMQEKKDEKLSLKAQILDWLKFGIKLILIYLVITNSVGFTKVYGDSMSPSLKDGSILMVNRLSSYFGSPKIGDVVIIREDGKEYDIVKRVIGLPGDTVAIKDGTVYVDDNPLPEIYALGEPNDMDKVLVPEGEIFVLGDNRTPGESLDSRDPSMGPVSIDDIKGYAVISLYPFYKIMKPLKI